MKNKLHYSAQALRDLDGIWDYIRTDLGNPKAAERMVVRIEEDIDKLALFPNMGTPLASIVPVDNGTRFLVTQQYMTFYRVQNADVYIDRILYGRRDYLRILFKDLSDDSPQ